MGKIEEKWAKRGNIGLILRNFSDFKEKSMILRAAAAVDPNKIQQFHDFYSKNVINEPIHFKKHKHFALFLLHFLCRPLNLNNITTIFNIICVSCCDSTKKQTISDHFIKK